MRTAVRSNSMMFLLLASAASLCCAPMALALSSTNLSPAGNAAQASDTTVQQAFEGAATQRPGLALDESGASAETAEETAPAVNSKAAPAGDETQSDKTLNGGAAGEKAGDDKSAGDAKDAADPRPAEIIRDLSTLPAPVKAMREKIVEAAASGDIERMRPLMETAKPQVMNGEADDPIDTLKGFSGDPEGQEILAIILDLMASGAARVDAGTPDEAYVWPYFVGKPLADLTPPERVELLRIVTAGDLMGMEETGNYNFYRLGITPDGRWKFIAGGD